MRARIASIENLISRDPGGRNIFGLVRRDHLRLAALSLAQARRVLIVSGFYIPAAGAGETDGPPGAKALGDALAALGIEVAYATDAGNRPLFEALGCAPLHGWAPELLEALRPSHLVAVERVGRARDGRYYNMRGEDLQAEAEPLDEWFLQAEERGIVTVGVGDGGNEIGMGRVFAHVQDAVRHGDRIASTVPTDYVVVAGTSNWGAYGLSAALSIVTGRDLLPHADTAAGHVRTICAAGAVDGTTREFTETVDSLPLAQSTAVLEQLRQHLTPPLLRERRGLTVGVMGLGETGIAAARLLRRQGHRLRLSDQARVALPADLADAPNELGGHTLDFLAGADCVVTSPGIAARAPLVAELRQRRVPVISELEAASQLGAPPPIAVTGSHGKRTTAELIARLFAAHGRPLPLGGNKGAPFSALLAEANEGRPCVLAVSSYQLESVVHFRPAVAVMLNLDEHLHLERHGSRAEYLRIKSRVFMNQRGEDVLILNGDDPALAPLAEKSWGRVLLLSCRGPVPRGVWCEGGRAWARVQGDPVALGPAPPEHPENTLAAAAVGLVQGVSPETVSAALFG